MGGRRRVVPSSVHGRWGLKEDTPFLALPEPALALLYALQPQEFRVMVEILRRWNPRNGTSFPCPEKGLARELGTSRSTVRRAVMGLENRRLIHYFVGSGQPGTVDIIPFLERSRRVHTGDTPLSIRGTPLVSTWGTGGCTTPGSEVGSKREEEELDPRGGASPAPPPEGAPARRPGLRLRSAEARQREFEAKQAASLKFLAQASANQQRQKLRDPRPAAEAAEETT